MTSIEFVGAMLSIAVLAANYFDVKTTNEALKIPGVTETTAFMRWCQKVLGAEWWVPKTVIAMCGIALAWFAILTQPIISQGFALFLLLGLTAAYAQAAFHNIKVKEQFGDSH